MRQYYLQDARTVCGNAAMWWAQDRKGYTADLNKAHVFSQSEVTKGVTDRGTDIAWPKELIDSLAAPTCDVQRLRAVENRAVRQGRGKP